MAKKPAKAKATGDATPALPRRRASGAGRRVRTIEAPQRPEGAIRTPPPRPLGSILGQPRGVGALRTAIASGRLHHAWVFHGPEGIGKFTAALAFAAVVLDPTSAPDLSGEIAPDPDSPTQHLLAADSHPGLVVVRKELAPYSRDEGVRASKQRTIALHVVQEFLIEPAGRSARLEGGLASRVFVVDEAELMGREAQNALLKTLEEPPPGTVIVLVTSNEDRLLPTIRSRCQRVGFAPLDRASLERWMGQAGPPVDADERQWLLDHADGSPGWIERAQRAGLHAWWRAISPLLDRADAGDAPIELGKTMTDLVEGWAKAWVDQGSKVGENRSKDAANRAGAGAMLALVAARYRGRLRDARHARRAVRAVDLVARAERLLGSNVAMQLVMDDLAVGLGEPQ